MITMFDRKPRMILTGGGVVGVPFNLLLTRQRSEGRLMLSDSCSDIRAWSSIPLEYTKYFHEQVEQNDNISKPPSKSILESVSDLKASDSLFFKDEFDRYKNLVLSAEQKLFLEEVKDDISLNTDKTNVPRRSISYVERSTSPIYFPDQKDATVQADFPDYPIPTNKRDLELQPEYENPKEKCQSQNHLNSLSQSSESDSSSECDSHSFSCFESESIRKKYDSLKQDCIRQDSEIIALKCQLNVKEKDIEELKSQNEELRTTLQRTEQHRIDLNEKIQAICLMNQREKQNLKSEFQYQENQMNECLRKYKNEIESLHHRIKELDYENEEIRASALEKKKKMQREIEELKRKCNENSEALKELYNENDELLIALKEKNDSCNYYKEQCNALATELKKAKKRRQYFLNSIAHEDSSKVLTLVNESGMKSDLSDKDSSDEEYVELKKQKEKHFDENVPGIIDDENDEENELKREEESEIVNTKLEIEKQNQCSVNYIKVSTDIKNIDAEIGNYNREIEEKVIIEMSNKCFKQFVRVLEKDKHNMQHDSEKTHEMMSIFQQYKIEKDDLQQQLKEKLQEIESLEEQLTNRNAELVRKTEEMQLIPQLQIMIENKDIEIKELNKKLADFLSKEDMDQNLEEFEKLKNELQQAMTYLKEQEREQSVFEESVRLWKVNLEKEDEELKEALSVIKSEKESLQKDFEVILSESKSKDRKIEEISRKLGFFLDIKKRVEQMGVKLEALQTENENLRKEIKQKDEKINNYEEKVNELSKPTVPKIDEAEINRLEAEITSRDLKLDQLTEQISKQRSLIEELKIGQDTSDYLRRIYNEISKVCEHKWKLEERLKSCKLQLSNDQNANRKLEIELQRIKGENDAIYNDMKRLKENEDRLRIDLLSREVYDQTCLSDTFNRLFNHVTILGERCQLSDLNGEHLRKIMVRQVEKHDKSIQINIVEGSVYKVKSEEGKFENAIKNLKEDNDKLQEELQMREDKHNEEMQILQQKYENQLESLRIDHNNSIELLMTNFGEHERNPQYSPDNEEWLKNLNTKELMKMDEQINKYLNREMFNRQEFESYVNSQLKQKDSEISRVKCEIKKINIENLRLAKENDALKCEIGFEKKINEDLIEQLHGNKFSSKSVKSSKSKDKHSHSADLSRSSSRRSNSEYSESDRSHRSTSSSHKKSKSTRSSSKHHEEGNLIYQSAMEFQKLIKKQPLSLFES